MTIHIEETHRVVDDLTGELLSMTTATTDINTAPTEPNYLKLYIDDLGLLNKLSGGETRALIHIAALANYDGEVVLPLLIKKRIAEKAGVKVQAISDTIVKLIKKGILKRVGATVYLLNPDLFARGKWREIRERRKTFQSVTTYYPNGEKTIETNMLD
jgi:sulfur transfer complex TusBCD TusB component (DsrH family)